MNSTPRNSPSASLRQRRSRSPPQQQSHNNHKHPVQKEEETQSLLGNNGSPSRPLLESNGRNGYHQNGNAGGGGSNGKDKDEDKNYNYNPSSSSPPSAMQLAWSISIGAVVLIVLVVASLCLFWLSVFTGIYNPDSSNDCPVPTFEYPDCSDAAMHTGDVDPPLKFDEWLQLRQQFQKALQLGTKIKNSEHDNAPLMGKDWAETDTYGFFDMSSIEFRYSPGRGRAVYATQPIAKGTKIWDSRYRAVFPNSCVAKIFFANQTNQQKCDAMYWGYANNFYGNGVQYMFDLDGHGYINHHGTEPNAVHHFENELHTDQYTLSRLRIPSLGVFPLAKQDWERRNLPGAYGLYASKDIQAGDEILYNYDEIYNVGFGDWFSIFICNSLPIWDWNTL